MVVPVVAVRWEEEGEIGDVGGLLIALPTPCSVSGARAHDPRHGEFLDPCRPGWGAWVGSDE